MTRLGHLSQPSNNTQSLYVSAHSFGLPMTQGIQFGAAGYDIDLLVMPQRNLWAVSGRLLGAQQSNQVVLNGSMTVQSDVDEVGAFCFNAIPQGIYMLMLLLDDIDIMVKNLKVGFHT
ncbi:MAG: hypothetical protein AAGF95_17525 [Chloroflexota bacterium]